jgi:hypothetical protein
LYPGKKKKIIHHLKWLLEIQVYGKHDLIWRIHHGNNIGWKHTIFINAIFVINSEIAGTLSNENDTLRDQMRQTEKDTIDVVTYLKKQDVDKDTEVNYHH